MKYAGDEHSDLEHHHMLLKWVSYLWFWQWSKPETLPVSFTTPQRFVYVGEVLEHLTDWDTTGYHTWNGFFFNFGQGHPWECFVLHLVLPVGFCLVTVHLILKEDVSKEFNCGIYKPPSESIVMVTSVLNFKILNSLRCMLIKVIWCYPENQYWLLSNGSQLQ